ncbi:hypothetical protein OIV83_000889 [Microbotryomycetes sp. JL201]|nr:hypothetical protein OIV83_000889 [Microbotryomycetes sp. JL201]
MCAIVLGAPLEKRATVLASGSSMQSGKVNSALSYQASGRLIAGGCPYGTGISSCYQVLLGASGNLARRSELAQDGVDDVYSAESSVFFSPIAQTIPEWEDESGSAIRKLNWTDHELAKRASARQRIELYSMPMAGAGSSWTYQWKSYLSGSGFSTTGSWNHLFQLLSRGGGRTGPILTLDVRNGKAFVTAPGRCNECASMPISSFTGRTIKHTLTVKFGSSGRLLYTATNAATGQRLLSYSMSGDTGSDASLKAGAYREVVSGMTPLKAFVGDFSFHRNS